MNTSKYIITAIVFAGVVHEFEGYAAGYGPNKHIEPNSYDPASWPVQITATGSGMFSSFTGNFTGSGFSFDHINCTVTR